MKPRVLSTLLPCGRAHRLAPLPRWATITRPPAPGRDLGQDGRDVLVRQAVEAVAPQDAPSRISRGRGTSSATAGWPRWKARIEAGHLRHVRQAVEDRLDGRPGCRAGAAETAGTSFSSLTEDGRVNPHRDRVKTGPAVHDAVADAEHPGARAHFDRSHAARGVSAPWPSRAPSRPAPVHDFPPPPSLAGTPGGATSPRSGLGLPGARPRLGLGRQVELQARGAGVEYEERSRSWSRSNLRLVLVTGKGLVGDSMKL